MAEKAEEINIDYLAELARISLTDEEKDNLRFWLEKILGFFDKINAVDVTGVEPMAHTFPVYNVWDEDHTTVPYTVEQALMNAPQKSHHQIVVPKVVE